MDNEAMYNTFIKDRTQQEEGESANETTNPLPRVSEDDLPTFDIEVEEIEVDVPDVEDPEDEDPVEEEVVVPEETFIEGPAMGVESSLEGMGVEQPLPVEDTEYARLDDMQPNPVGSFEEFLAQHEAEQEAAREAAQQHEEEPQNNQSEFEDFRREPEGIRDVPQNDLYDDEDLLTAPAYQFEGGGATLPPPDIFNAYPPEVQRKIMEWADRDLKARRDDESRRQDAILRANIARDRTRTAIPVCIIVLCIFCAAFLGVLTQNPFFVVAFLVVAIIFIAALFVYKRDASNSKKTSRKYMRK